MKKIFFSVFLIVQTVSFSANAYAEQIWTCNYSGSSVVEKTNDTTEILLD